MIFIPLSSTCIRKATEMHSKYQQGALGDTHGCPQNSPVRPVPKTAHRDDRQQVKQILCGTTTQFGDNHTVKLSKKRSKTNDI